MKTAGMQLIKCTFENFMLHAVVTVQSVVYMNKYLSSLVFFAGLHVMF